MNRKKFREVVNERRHEKRCAKIFVIQRKEKILKEAACDYNDKMENNDNNKKKINKIDEREESQSDLE